MNSASALFRLLGDEARLRILRLLSLEQLNVSELTGILGIAQSGVSRHLGLLKEADLVSEQSRGRLHVLQTGARRFPTTTVTARRWLRSCATQFATAAGDLTRMDDARLEEVRRLRKENFDAHARPGHQRTAARAGPELGRLGPRTRATCFRRSASRTSAAARAT